MSCERENAFGDDLLRVDPVEFMHLLQRVEGNTHHFLVGTFSVDVEYRFCEHGIFQIKVVYFGAFAEQVVDEFSYR